MLTKRNFCLTHHTERVLSHLAPHCWESSVVHDTTGPQPCQHVFWHGPPPQLITPAWMRCMTPAHVYIARSPGSLRNPVPEGGSEPFCHQGSLSECMRLFSINITAAARGDCAEHCQWLGWVLTGICQGSQQSVACPAGERTVWRPSASPATPAAAQSSGTHRWDC